VAGAIEGVALEGFGIGIAVVVGEELAQKGGDDEVAVVQEGLSLDVGDGDEAVGQVELFVGEQIGDARKGPEGDTLTVAPDQDASEHAQPVGAGEIAALGQGGLGFTGEGEA
jgi:hypothetical protein